MKKIPERFITDISKFEGEGIDVKVTKKRESSHLFKIDTVVTIPGIEGKIKIDAIWPIFEKVMYDYRGIIETETGAKYIYFNHSADIQQEN